MATSPHDAVPPVIEPARARRKALKETVGLTLATLAAIKIVLALQTALSLPTDVLIAIPMLFLGAPMLLLRFQRRDPEELGMILTDLRSALKLNALLGLVVLLPFVVGNHFYQTLFFHRHPQGVFPKHFWSDVVLYQIVGVGIPEEFFYRGYVQSRLNEVFPKHFEVLGVTFGPGLFIAALLFTLGHSFIIIRWWHFAIFFPALLFGWIRERTGNVLAGGLFHAMCNILMVTLDTWYGVIQP